MAKKLLSWLYKSKSPLSAGVYFFRDPKGQMLYIGKAANLKKRLASYRKTADQRIRRMLETAKDLDWQETSSEIEALILESQLIKKYRPPFNIMLRDDKQYFYVGITKEAFSRIFLTHQPTKTGQAAIRPTLDPRLFAREFSGRSIAAWPKANFVGPFTEGSSLKSTLKLLRKIFPYCTCKQKHHRYCLNYHLENCLGFCCLKDPNFTKEQKLNYQKNIRAVRDVLNGKRVSVLKNIEKEMKTEGKNGNFEKAIEWRHKLDQLGQVFENAKVIKEMASHTDALADLAKTLGLPSAQRIEGYDISNIQGQFATGAMVVFTNGQPDKNEYRKFKIRTVPADQGGDVAMLKEMLTRRFNHSEWPSPDLIVVDGGQAQLSTTRSTAPAQIPIISLTKDDHHHGHHIFISNQKGPIALSKLSPAVRNLILHLDSEAHRFAISYYRKLHRKII